MDAATFIILDDGPIVPNETGAADLNSGAYSLP